MNVVKAPLILDGFAENLARDLYESALDSEPIEEYPGGYHRSSPPHGNSNLWKATLKEVYHHFEAQLQGLSFQQAWFLVSDKAECDGTGIHAGSSSHQCKHLAYPGQRNQKLVEKQSRHLWATQKKVYRTDIELCSHEFS